MHEPGPATVEICWYPATHRHTVLTVFVQAVTSVCVCAVSHVPHAVEHPAVGLFAHNDGVVAAL